MRNFKWFNKFSVVGAAGLLAAASILGFALSAAPAAAALSRDPSNCTSNGVGISITLFRADGTTVIFGGSKVKDGETIKYRSTLSFLGGTNCAFGGGTWTITDPHGVVTNLGAVPEIGGAGVSSLDSALVSYVVAPADEAGGHTITATTAYAGFSRDGNDSPVSASTGISTTVAHAKIAISPDGTNEITKTHTFIGLVQVDNGSGFVPADNGTVINFSLSGVGGLSSPTCTTSGGTGSCTVTDTSAVTGVDTVNASADVSQSGGVAWGTTISVTTNGTAGNSGPATKTWVNLQILITGNSTNEIGVDHTFTVTVNEDLGKGGGFVPLSGATVVPGITGTGSLTGTGTCQTGTTNGSGLCTIIVHSATPGVGTVSASVTSSVGGSAPITRALGDGLSGDSPKSTKTWVDANIQISPLTATDPVNDNHVLTAHVNVNTGTGGYVSAPDGTMITFTIVSGPGSFTTTNPCTTSGGTGSCSVTLTSPTTGTTMVKAATAVVVGGVTLNRATGDTNTGDSANASKTWTQTALTTTASGTVQIGGAIHDVAHLTGTSSATTGHVTFDVFGPSVSPVCVTPLNGSPIAATPDPVIADGDYTSGNFTPTSAGTYYWIAHYSGDTKNNPANTACGDAGESVVVTPKTPTISTKLSATTVNVNTPVHDSATLTGATSNAGGTVKYSAYAGANTCTGTDLLNSTVTVTSGVVPDSANFTPTAGGTYSFQAVYSGDTNNTGPVSSDCTTEQLTVNNFVASMTTAIHQGATDSGSPVVVTSVPAGSTVHDSAMVTGTGPTPTGNVVFTFFSGTGAGTCSVDTSTSVPAGTVALVAGVADPSSAEGPLAAGTYGFRATYAGGQDANYPNGATSDCEPLTVTKLNPTITTTLSATTVNINTAVHDSATLAGATTNAGGTVTYSAFAGANTCTGTDLLHSTVTVTGGVVPNSSDFTPTTAGTYSFMATYSGDGNNTGPVSSVCSTEQLVVSKASPTLGTTPNPASGNVGAVLNDSATLTGGFNPTGSITFTLFAPTDATCSGTGVMTQTVPLVGTSATTTPGFTSNAAGTWHWTASYPGDANNNPATSICSAEPVTITSPQVPTRTLGFWQTHTTYTESIFNGVSHGSVTLGGMVINTNGKLFGGFLAGISKTSTGTKRTALDQARMQLAQQWLAAELNCEAFGCPGNISALLASASTDFSTGTASQILADESALDTYNNSGDTLGNPAAGAATPKDSSAIADMVFWDVLH